MQARLDVQEQDEKKSLNNPGADEVMEKAGGKNAGLPFFAFLDEKGETIVNSLRPAGEKGRNIGHPYEPEEIDWFLEMLKKGAPGITPEENRILEDWLRTQKK